MKRVSMGSGISPAPDECRHLGSDTSKIEAQFGGAPDEAATIPSGISPAPDVAAPVPSGMPPAPDGLFPISAPIL